MNRRKLLKAISYLVAALVVPLGLIARAFRGKVTHYPGQNKQVEVFIVSEFANSDDTFLDNLPPKFKQLFGEQICKRCHRKWKDHLPQEFKDCLNNGGAAQLPLKP